MATVLSGTGSYEQISFERQYPTGVSSRHPHLDVVLDGEEAPIAIESKFLEIYDEPKHVDFSHRYIESQDLWIGMPTLNALAQDLMANPQSLERLGAAQLIKHTLGLAREYGHDGFQLLYLWYDFHSEAAVTHRTEVERFTEIARQGITFSAHTYQELYGKLSRLEEPSPGYLGYLASRYGLG